MSALHETIATRNISGAMGDDTRKQAEADFHDAWAASAEIERIDVRGVNEACTAPEMRHIARQLGDLRGRSLLDVGCGLGEAAVYFALGGADVTATDISPGMCAAAQRLAAANGVNIRTHVAAAEDFGAPAESKFDVLYVGHALHHVDIAAAMPRWLRQLTPNGIFVSWDPVAYNPLINVYRRRATKTRTSDEHPLRLADIRRSRGHFEATEVRWFWLCTLLIFVCMALVQRRDPNEERFWKKVVEEAERWRWLYQPLEFCDRVLLWVPPLRPLCWNVVIIGRGLRRAPSVPQEMDPSV